MKKHALIICLQAMAALTLTGCGAATTPQPFFSHYLGQTRAYVMEHEGTPDEFDIYKEGQGLTYKHKTYHSRDFNVIFAAYDERVFTVSVTDNQPERAPLVQFADWRAACVIGKNMAEIMDTIGPPQTYTHIMPPPEAAAHYPFFDRETESMEYSRAEVNGVPYAIYYGLHNGRVESISFFCQKAMSYADFTGYVLELERPLTALLDEPAWVRCLTEFKMEPEDVYRWQFTKRMVDERYLLWFGGRVYDNAYSNFLVVVMYDLDAADPEITSQLADNFESMRTVWDYPECERGGDLSKLPSLPTISEEQP